MIEWFIESASTYSTWIDNQILLITILVGFWFILSEAIFFGLIFKYRAGKNPKADYITGKEKGPKKFINTAHALVILCDVFVIVGAIWVWVEVKQKLPPADAEIQITGQQWAWTFEHPGPDGKLGTEDDIQTTDELFIEVDKTYHFHLVSTDVLHSFSVPVFRLKQDAIPGREITGWFEATKTGDFDIQCAEMCGIGHGLMAARLHIQTAEQHASWIGEHPNVVAVEATTE
jgi:cytochrome c oxidase subunit 2